MRDLTASSVAQKSKIQSIHLNRMFTLPYRGRFAPSPTGPLHAGSLLTALVSWLLAKQAGGQWWLRIEDVDPPREVTGAAEDQLRTLLAFGLQPDAPVVFQSQRANLYQAALDQLLTSGQAFECHCSRGALAASGGIHRQCVANHKRPDPAIRLRVPEGCRIDFIDAIHGHMTQHVDAVAGDFVLRRSDGLWAYQLAVVVDDAAQGMTDIVRGADLLDSTPRQIFLQQTLGLPTPRYVHLPLLVDAQGHKLSKSTAALAVSSERPLATLQELWRLLGQTALPQAHDAADFLRQAVATFQLQQVAKQAICISAAAHNTKLTQHA